MFLQTYLKHKYFLNHANQLEKKTSFLPFFLEDAGAVFEAADCDLLASLCSLGDGMRQKFTIAPFDFRTRFVVVQSVLPYPYLFSLCPESSKSSKWHSDHRSLIGR